MSEESLIKKIQPYSKEAEQGVIGSMLLDKDAISVAVEKLVPEDFYVSQYGTLFKAMQTLYKEGRPSDLITVFDKLKEMDVPPEICSIEFVNEIQNMVPTSANIKAYVDIVAEKSLARQIIKFSDGLSNSCYLDKTSVFDVLEEAERQVFKLNQNRRNVDFEETPAIVYRTLQNIEKAAKAKNKITGVATGFTDLDYKLAGLQKSDFILIAARPSMGKTAFALNIAEYVAVHSNLTTAIFSLEMSKELLVNRLLSMNSKIEAQSIRTGSLKDGEWNELLESARILGDSSLIIDDTPGISISELRSKCRKLKAERNLQLVMIDYLQLMSGGGRVESRQQEIAEISRSLKSLAREIECPVIALSQLSRAVESRDDKRPMLSDLRESGSIEQDADVVMFIYREDYYKKDTENKGISEIIIAKQRNGPIGTVRLAWLPQYTKFGNLENKKE